MRKERRNLLPAVLVAVALVGGLAWLVFRSHEPPEPVYQGKRLSEWLLPRTDGTFDPGAKQAVHKIGTNAIPTLLRMLRARDSKLKRKFRGLAKKQTLIEFHFVDAETLNEIGAWGFNLLGAAASNAVPALIRIYEQNLSEASQRTTADALGGIGPAATAAVPLLLLTAGNPKASEGLRSSVLLVLGQIHVQSELVVPALIKCLNDSEPFVRECAATALMSFGSDAKTAVPKLVDLLKDPDADVRKEAGSALKAIDPEAAAKAGVK